MEFGNKMKTAYKNAVSCFHNLSQAHSQMLITNILAQISQSKQTLRFSD